MDKAFIYLNPIEEYTKFFTFHNEVFYDKWQVLKPLPIIDECLTKRYRDNGYKVIFVTYRDRDIYGLTLDPQDLVIATDIIFSENSATDEHGHTKKNFVPRFPNYEEVLKSIGNVKHLVIGGYHFNDCVLRMAKCAHDAGIDTTIDLELTDLFFSLYQKEYFKTDTYDPDKFKTAIMEDDMEFGYDLALKQFNGMFNDPLYGFSEGNKAMALKKP